jgi:hypothetical protein
LLQIMKDYKINTRFLGDDYMGKPITVKNWDWDLLYWQIARLFNHRHSERICKKCQSNYHHRLRRWKPELIRNMYKTLGGSEDQCDRKRYWRWETHPAWWQIDYGMSQYATTSLDLIEKVLQKNTHFGYLPGGTIVNRR